MRVLIVDDEPGICQHLQRELQKEGCEVDYTTSAIGVLERLKNAEQEGRDYALLLLDLRMPKLDGFSLLKEIREARIDLEVVIITGYGDEDKAIESIRLGAVDYLPKPISLEALHTAVFRVQQKQAAEEKRALAYSVLVVDDEKELCERIKRELDKEGYRTAVAYDGVEGLDYFSHNRVGVVIVDIKMPRMSGLEMLGKCREITDDFVSIIITGHGGEERAIQALQLGVFNYLRKPVSLEGLVTSVGKGIELLHLRRSVAARRRELEIEAALKEQYAQNLERMVEERTKEIKKLSDAVKASTESIVISDLEGKITDINEATREMYGTGDKEDLVGKSSFDLIAPEDRQKAVAGMEEALEKGYIKDREYHVITNDGSRLPVEMSVSIMKGVAGEAIGFVGVTRDISERKRAEQELHESEARYRAFFTTSRDCVFITSQTGKWLYMNDAAVELFGYASRAELSQVNIQDHYANPEEWAKYISIITERGYTKEFPVDLRKKDGVVIHALITAVPRYDADGNVTGFQGTIRDITERRRAEEKLKNSLMEKEVLLKEVHHRVKNNLMTIIGLIKMQEAKANNEIFNPLLLELEGRVRAMALVHESLHKSESLARIDLQNYIEALIANIRAQFGAKRDIRFSVQAAGVDVNLDIAVPCGLILNELISNTFKHAFPGGKPRAGEDNCEISVFVKKDDRVCLLTVADNGIGMPANLDWEKAETLGLQLIKMLSKQLNGSIELDRSAGTVFRLKFPVTVP